MSDKEIFIKLKNIIKPYLEEGYEIRLDSDISRNLGVKSIDLIKIIVDIEDIFKCSINDADMLNIRSIEDMIRLIKKSL